MTVVTTIMGFQTLPGSQVSSSPLFNVFNESILFPPFYFSLNAIIGSKQVRIVKPHLITFHYKNVLSLSIVILRPGQNTTEDPIFFE